MGLLTLCLSAGFALGQEPIVDTIVELKVTPERGKLKEGLAWDKPIVIHSQDEAAKLFDKAALATITKKVDFKKQIVLVFAWDGSGDDKLEYKILESRPEQVSFSLQPGASKNDVPHSRVFALRSNVKWSVKAPK
ncbi:MAG: hypothetical protein HY289_13105 [Planctomycetes bacterium]|nr:hypothetical protein [Planctomycetota bacterium]